MKVGCFSFGSFVLIPDRQILLKGDVQVHLGTRALEILTILARRAGEVISKQELLSLVWSDTFVDESNLKVNIAAIRRALDEDGTRQSCIATVIGRGYRFIETVQIHASNAVPAVRRNALNLPLPPKRLIGRTEDIQQLTSLIEEHRLITIVGSPGVGKTAVAVAVAEALSRQYEAGICFADMSSVDDPASIPCVIGAALGLLSTSDNMGERICSYLMRRKMLLVIDSCERIVEALAVFVEHALSCCPDLHFLATSRETLRAGGERVFRLAGLSFPSYDSDLNLEELSNYSAVQLFAEQVAEREREHTFTVTEAAMITDLCRVLDGVPLAIELAALPVRALGFQALGLAIFDFLLFHPGLRTGPRRHQSLAASLDWSFDSLSENEHAVLLKLARLQGCFDLNTAIAFASEAVLSTTEAIASIASLVSKSLLERQGSDLPRFRLLHSVRYYALQQLTSHGSLHAKSGDRTACRNQHNANSGLSLQAVEALAS